MKNYSSYVGLIITITCCIGLSNLTYGQGSANQGSSSQGFSRSTGSANARAFGNASGNASGKGFGNSSGSVNGRAFGNTGGTGGQNPIGYGRLPRSGNGFQQRSNTSASGSRSVSFSKDGQNVSIKENAAGITVSVNGQSVQAKDAAELKRKYPDAYRLYEKYIGAARFGGSARAGGSAGGGSGRPGQFNTTSTKNRSISVIDNGKKVSITENKTGISVSVNGKRIRAKNAEALKKKSPDAFRIYEKHMGAAGIGQNAQPNATDLLREELNKLRDQHADNPQMTRLIEQMMQNISQ